MANWGSCEVDGLLKLQEQVDTLAYNLYQSGFQQFCEQCANEIADELLRRLKKRTPVGVKPQWAISRAQSLAEYASGQVDAEGKARTRTRYRALFAARSITDYWAAYQGGHLRRSWEVRPVKKTGNAYEIEVINFAPYASYVEFGHKQTPGRYVPVLGVALKKPWVNGQRFMTQEEEKMRGQIQAILDKKMERFLKEAFK